MKPALVHQFLCSSAARFPDKDAIVASGGRTTYAQLAAQARSIAHWLCERGMCKGDRIGILTDSPEEYVSIYFGILMAGGTVVALNTQTSDRTLQYIFNNCSVSVLFVHRKFIRFFEGNSSLYPTLRDIVVTGRTGLLPGDLQTKVHDYSVLVGKLACGGQGEVIAADVTPEDLAQIIYTSGTTGDPKGVMLSHRSLAANAYSIVRYLHLTEHERHMVVLPFFYSYGNSLLTTHVLVGATLVVYQSLLYPKVVLDQMQQERVTGFSGVPSTYAILLNRSPVREYALPHLRYLAQAGGAMSPKLARELKCVFPAVDVYIMYGQTEASARLSYLEPEQLLKKSGSIGRAIPGVELQLLDGAGQAVSPGETGEIVASGDNIMAGYWNDPQQTARVLKDGRLWTGDLARMDEDGYLYIVSRKSEMIKSGAHRIAPKEIEEIILEEGSVHEVAVLGVADEILGEAIVACIVLKESHTVTPREILAHCKKNLPAFKVPHRVVLCTELPKTTSGKIKKAEINLSAQEPVQ